MKTLVLLPTYNEKENISRLCKEILEAVPFVHIFIIDDNSPDGTGEIADELSRTSNGAIFVLHRSGKLGLGTAIMAGFEYAIKNNYDLAINMDCDFSHRPQELPQMIRAAESADLVVASRHIKGGEIIGWNWRRRALHKIAQVYTSMVLGSYVHDHTNSYKAYRVETLKRLALANLNRFAGGYVWHTLLIYLIHRSGYRIMEVPSIFPDRRFGTSKMNVKEMFSGLVSICKARFFSFSDR